MNKKFIVFRNNIADQLKKNKWFYYSGIGIVLFICLVIFNYWIGKKINEGNEFLFNWVAARNLLFNGVSPYAKETITSYLEIANSLLLGGQNNNYHFITPLFSLFFYFPLAYLSDFFLARSIWMAVIEITLFASGYFSFKVLNWNPSSKIRFIILGFSFLFYFSLINLKNGSSLILTNLFFILGLFFFNHEKYELSGVTIALATINIQIFLLPLIGIFICILRKKAWSFFIWYVITLFLLGVAGCLFIPDWLIQNIRQILNYPQDVNLQLPGEIIRNWIPAINPNIINILMLLFFSWLIFEWFYFFRRSTNYVWIICFTTVISLFLFIQNYIQGLIILFLPFIYIINQWNNRNIQIGYLFTILISTFFSIGLVILASVSKSLFADENYPLLFYFISPVFILINLYWVKWWGNKPLTYD
jgi:hypothetical protein